MEYKKLMYCYSEKSKLLALIDVNAISEISWHKDGMYIYWRKKVDNCGTITTERAGCIICDWTKVKEVLLDKVKSKNKGKKIILEDNSTYNTCPDFELIG